MATAQEQVAAICRAAGGVEPGFEVRLARWIRAEPRCGRCDGTGEIADSETCDLCWGSGRELWAHSPLLDRIVPQDDRRRITTKPCRLCSGVGAYFDTVARKIHVLRIPIYTRPFYTRSTAPIPPVGTDVTNLVTPVLEEPIDCWVVVSSRDIGRDIEIRVADLPPDANVGRTPLHQTWIYLQRRRSCLHENGEDVDWVGVLVILDALEDAGADWIGAVRAGSY